MSRQALLVATLLTVLLPRIGSSQALEVVPRPEVKGWDFWIGEWTLAGTARDTPTGAEYPVDWSAHGRWILGGAGIELTSTWKGTGPASQWVEILSWDPAGRTHTFTGFSSEGEVWRGTTIIGSDGFVEDYVSTVSDGQTSQCHNEWIFGPDRLTISGNSVCQRGEVRWTSFTVSGRKVRTPSGPGSP